MPDDILTRAADMDGFLRAVLSLQRTARLQHRYIQRLEAALAGHGGGAPVPGSPATVPQSA